MKTLQGFLVMQSPRVEMLRGWFFLFQRSRLDCCFDHHFSFPTAHILSFVLQHSACCLWCSFYSLHSFSRHRHRHAPMVLIEVTLTRMLLSENRLVCILSSSDQISIKLTCLLVQIHSYHFISPFFRPSNPSSCCLNP